MKSIRNALSSIGSMFLAIPVLGYLIFALRTTAGRDFQAGVMSSTSSNGTGSYAPANYIGLTATATAPAAGDTVLAGEIASGTLSRALAAYSHAGGASTYTLIKTFTSDQTVTIAVIGVFNAATAGTLVFETALSSTASLVSGDTLQITELVTL